jgi:hypothetical protein
MLAHSHFASPPILGEELMTKDEALKMAIDALEEIHVGNMTPMAEINWNIAIQACKEALEQEERTQRTMHCGTADAFIAMDDDHKRRWFVQSLRESKRRKELEDILEPPAQEPVAYMYKDQPNSVLILYLPQQIPKSAIPLYTHPAPSWQGLSDDEILEIDKSIDPEISIGKGKTLFARAIDKALMEKNA